MKQMEKSTKSPKLDEIDIVELLQKVWQARSIALKFSILSALFGVFFALNSPNVYTAGSTFLPKGKSSGNNSSLRGFASLAGIDLGGMNASSSEIPPTLYPMLVKSNSFLDLLLNTYIESREMTLKSYLLEEPKETILTNIKSYTIGLPSKITSLFYKKETKTYSKRKLNSVKRISLSEEKLYRKLKGMISVKVDKDEGFITLTVNERDPEIVAIIAANAQNILQKQVIDFKIKNAQELLEFTEKLYAEKKAESEILQDELATFRDKHQNITSGLFQNKINRLEAKFVIANSVNEELAKQVEQAKIQVREDTPIFTIINAVTVPNNRTSPKRMVIVLFFIVMGLFLGLTYKIIKEPLSQFIKKIRTTNPN